jgi:hypothetical protein
MTSTYKYITVAQLEAYTGRDYSAINASYTDTIIEAWITQAERIVNKLKGTTYSVTIPDDVVTATLEISMRIAHNRLLMDGHFFNQDAQRLPLVDDDIFLLAANSDKDFYAYGYARADGDL